jgi:hypothetical protein
MIAVTLGCERPLDPNRSHHPVGLGVVGSDTIINMVLCRKRLSMSMLLCDCRWSVIVGGLSCLEAVLVTWYEALLKFYLRE